MLEVKTRWYHWMREEEVNSVQKLLEGRLEHPRGLKG